MPFLLQPVDSPERDDNETLRALVRDYKSQADLTWNQLAKRVLAFSPVLKATYHQHTVDDAVTLLQRRLSDYKTNETHALPAEIADALLEYLCAALEKECEQLLKQENYRDLLERYIQAKNPFLLHKELSINHTEQGEFLAKYRSRYLAVSRIEPKRWEIAHLNIIEGSLSYHSIPRFFLWRQQDDSTFASVRGFALKSGDDVFFTGHTVNNHKIWSAACTPIGRSNDLRGAMLSLGNNRANDPSSRFYCINLSGLRAKQFRTLPGIRNWRELGQLKSILGTKRFELFETLMAGYAN